MENNFPCLICSVPTEYYDIEDKLVVRGTHHKSYCDFFEYDECHICDSKIIDFECDEENICETCYLDSFEHDEEEEE
jgi:hypothetical protein